MEATASQQVKGLDTGAGSAAVREARLLSSEQHQILKITDRQLDLADLCFRAIGLLLDDQDPRPMWDRLEDLALEFQDVVGPLDLEALELEADHEASLPYWLRRLSDPAYRRFVRRLLGAARVDRLAAALRLDAATLVVGLRRYLRYLLPVAAATDRCIRVLDPQQQAKIDGIDSLVHSTALELVVRLDALVSRFEEAGIHLDLGVARPSELAELPGPYGRIARSTDTAVSNESIEILEGLSAGLTRKVRGARDALAYSADPVSQAANSVLELVDRMLRNAFTADYVLEWIDRWFPTPRDDLIQLHGRKRRPTTRSRALCFIYAGEKPVETTVIHELAVEVIVAVRPRLQRLKHADAGTDSEREELIALLEAVEACMVLASRVTWLCAEDSSLGELRDRLVLSA